MELLFKAEAWPLWVCLGVTVLVALVEFQTRRMPNAIVLPFLAAGLLLGVAHLLQIPLGDNGQGNLGHALAVGLLAFGMLAPLWFMGLLGAGAVKLQMAIGAWLGAYYGLGLGATAIVWATLFASLCLMIAARIRYKQGERFVSAGIPQALGLLTAVLGMHAGFLPLVMR